jgi:hypothetical protein
MDIESFIYEQVIRAQELRLRFMLWPLKRRVMRRIYYWLGRAHGDLCRLGLLPWPRFMPTQRELREMEREREKTTKELDQLWYDRTGRDHR